MENIEKNAVPAVEESEEESLVLKFRKPYVFEGNIYTELDLAGLEDITADDLMVVGRILSKNGAVHPVPEMSHDFCIYMAARVCKMPVEFFKRLPAREAIRLKNTVTGFLYGGDGDN